MGENFGELESARVTRLLRDDIVLGRRLPGSRLVEREIAAELDVSRLPVREAIRALVGEGIVVSRPRTWAIVRTFTLADVRDFAEVRASMETLLFVSAAERHTEQEIANLRRMAEREEAAAREGDSTLANSLSGEFHEYVTEMAGNEMFTELVGVFATRLKWVFGLGDEPLIRAAEHRMLCDAIGARDVELVTRLIGRHLARGREAAERRFAEPARVSAAPTG